MQQFDLFLRHRLGVVTILRTRIDDIRNPCPRQSRDIRQVHAPADRQVLSYPAHVELIRQRNMQSLGQPLRF